MTNKEKKKTWNEIGNSFSVSAGAHILALIAFIQRLIEDQQVLALAFAWKEVIMHNPYASIVSTGTWLRWIGERTAMFARSANRFGLFFRNMIAWLGRGRTGSARCGCCDRWIFWYWKNTSKGLQQRIFRVPTNGRFVVAIDPVKHNSAQSHQLGVRCFLLQRRNILETNPFQPFVRNRGLYILIVSLAVSILCQFLANLQSKRKTIRIRDCVQKFKIHLQIGKHPLFTTIWTRWTRTVGQCQHFFVILICQLKRATECRQTKDDFGTIGTSLQPIPNCPILRQWQTIQILFRCKQRGMDVNEWVAWSVIVKWFDDDVVQNPGRRWFLHFYRWNLKWSSITCSISTRHRMTRWGNCWFRRPPLASNQIHRTRFAAFEEWSQNCPWKQIFNVIGFSSMRTLNWKIHTLSPLSYGYSHMKSDPSNLYCFKNITIPSNNFSRSWEDAATFE